MAMGLELEFHAGLWRRTLHQVKSPAFGVGDKP